MSARADSTRTTLRGVDFRNADLEESDLRDVVLDGTDLRGANLRGVNFSGASMRNVDLRGACLDGAILAGADLRGARFNNGRIGDLPATEEEADLGRKDAGASHVFRKERGDYWFIRYGNEEARLRDRKGVVYIHCLIQHEGRWVSATELLALTDPDAATLEQRRIQDIRQHVLDAQADTRDSLGFVRRHAHAAASSDEVGYATVFYTKELAELRQRIRGLHKNLYARVTNNMQRTLAILRKDVPAFAHHLRERITYRASEWLYLASRDDDVRWELF